MAALVAGVQYGLSSHGNFHENKSLIFVKLTDSAQRAIEDYLRNRNKIKQNPTIQFLGNEGQLSFPSAKTNHGNFTFSLSSNQDIEGPQGGFECVQQIGPKNLESLGALPCKMRIQANDDVYETTRHRMHVAEENNKNKCTRVIKANEPIGRKVKVKGTVRTIAQSNQLNLNPSLKPRESSTFLITTQQTCKASSSYKLAATHLAINRSQQDTQKKFSDIMRRPLKERLMHLLALRPFKRPELYDRINREGVREKEKNIIATVLKQIAFMRDNTYHLHRCVWNDVQEDWPFYTEQEKAMLKRRKPQNLTPPGSSDGGSSGSGQSPNSTHPGSPPAITSPPSEFLGSKRPGYYQGTDGLPTKRQRISHYRKPESSYSISSGDNGRTNVANGVSNSWDMKQQQQLQRDQQQQYQYHHNQQKHQQNNCITSKPNLTPTSDCEDITTTSSLVTVNKPSTAIDSLPNNKTNHNTHSILSSNNHLQCKKYQDRELQEYNIDQKITSSNVEESGDVVLLDTNAISTEHNLNSVSVFTQKSNGGNKICSIMDGNQCIASEIGLSSSNCSNDETSSYSKNNTVEDPFLSFPPPSCNSMSPASSENFRSSEYPDYLTCYTTISSSEQRTRYKAEFNAYYKEYRKLHVQVVNISKQFSQLEGQLREKLDCGNMEDYEAIKHQILQEYAKTKSVNARFYYLHDKLGHIKKLVSEYDAQGGTSSAIRNDNILPISSPDLTDHAFHRDVRDTRCTLIQYPSDQSITCSSKIAHIS